MKKLCVLAASLLAGGTIASAAKADVFYLNYEAPGVQNSTAVFSSVGIETFDLRTPGDKNLIRSSFGRNGAISGQYTPAAGNSRGVQINSADQYGGAGGTGNYVVSFINTSYTLTLKNNTALNPNGINYFGYWLSALDPGNQVSFYRDDTLLDTLTPADVLAHTGYCPDSANGYCGNPNAAFLGQDSAEPFVFINFYDTTGTFDKIVFTEAPNYGGGYESDNHTVGFYTQIGGVPEPSTYVMMGLGFAGLGLVGYRSSRRRLTSVA